MVGGSAAGAQVVPAVLAAEAEALAARVATAAPGEQKEATRRRVAASVARAET